jgi:hypothetical protein
MTWMTYSAPTPRRSYPITGVSSRRHAATHDFAGALVAAPCAVCETGHGLAAGNDKDELFSRRAIRVPCVISQVLGVSS